MIQFFQKVDTTLVVENPFFEIIDQFVLRSKLSYLFIFLLIILKNQLKYTKNFKQVINLDITLQETK